MKRKIILASGSPQRKKLLDMIGIDFEVHRSDYKENMKEKIPAYKLAQKLALGKAENVAKKYKDAIVIGSDCFGILDGKFLGKAHTPKDARKMLKKLSGRKHTMITGIAIIDTLKNKTITDHDIAEVWIKKLTIQEIEYYIKTKEPLNKAPCYTIEGIGSVFIEKIKGSYTTVLGLPVHKVYNIFKELNTNIFQQ